LMDGWTPTTMGCPVIASKRRSVAVRRVMAGHRLPALPGGQVEGAARVRAQQVELVLQGVDSASISSSVMQSGVRRTLPRSSTVLFAASLGGLQPRHRSRQSKRRLRPEARGERLRAFGHRACASQPRSPPQFSWPRQLSRRAGPAYKGRHHRVQRFIFCATCAAARRDNVRDSWV
jgi:hypothetical protein